MKKISVLVALALLVVAGTGYAVTCAQDNVPGATLLVPYFRVGGTGVVGINPIPDSSGADTLVAVTNVSNVKLITHVTIWNKYSAPVLDFNVPMTGYDVYFFSVRSILNGNLNVNPNAFPLNSSGKQLDACPFANGFARFSFPNAADKNAISLYAVPAFDGQFRARVWSSLDESGDVSDWNSPSTNTIDNDNWVCDVDGTTAAIKGDFTGYITIDVANYCSLTFPADIRTYTDGAIATSGWGFNTTVSGGPNVLFGDVIYKDQALNTGNISGDPAVSIEFDSRLTAYPLVTNKTFYGRYLPSPSYTSTAGVPVAFQFGQQGDGREPLGTRYGFRFFQDANAGSASTLKTWALIWRSDVYFQVAGTSTTLCGWWELENGNTNEVFPFNAGFTDSVHQITVAARDNDENGITTSGGPSGGPGGLNQFVWLETQRAVISPNTQVVLGTWAGGWIDLTMPGTIFEQAWVGVQHTGNGLAMSVGYSAALLNANSVCVGPGVSNLNIVTN